MADRPCEVKPDSCLLHCAQLSQITNSISDKLLHPEKSEANIFLINHSKGLWTDTIVSSMRKTDPTLLCRWHGSQKLKTSPQYVREEAHTGFLELVSWPAMVRTVESSTHRPLWSYAVSVSTPLKHLPLCYSSSYRLPENTFFSPLPSWMGIKGSW